MPGSPSTLIHLYISSAFSTEEYDHYRSLYVHQQPSFDGTLIRPDKPIGRLRLNLYGSKPSGYTGLSENLTSHFYTPHEAYPCLFTKHVKNGSTTAGITTDDFLITAPNEELINAIQNMLSTKHKVRNLGPPETYLGWTIQKTGTGPIHNSQPDLI